MYKKLRPHRPYRDLIRQGVPVESQFYYRDRMPEDFDWDWPTIITTAKAGNIGEGSPYGPMTVPADIRDKITVGIIGGGAAGQCAAYELMKLGVAVVIFEMQVDQQNTDYVRPGGRGYSIDFTNAYKKTDPNDTGTPSFTAWYPTEVDGPRPIDGQNVTTYVGGRQFTDLGAMRYPDSHVALHTYVDDIFAGDYFVADNSSSQPQWQPWRDPGLFESNQQSPDIFGRPSDDDTLRFPTVYYTTGIANEADLTSRYRGYYRIDRGETLGGVNEAINNLTYKNWYLLYGPEGTGPNGGPGYLRNIVESYVEYTAAAKEGNAEAMGIAERNIKQQWNTLSETLEEKDLYQVLIENGWGEEAAYGQFEGNSPAKPTLIEMFGEIGIGSGGFDVFWWTTFMETLRIRLHLDESNQEAVAGGTSYMIAPFLTHNATLYDNSTANLWTYTKGQVITSPVVAVKPVSGNMTGVTVATQDGSSFDVAACIMTVAPSAVRTRIDIDESLLTNRALRCLSRMRLTNSGKIAINFPGRTPTQTNKHRNAFWMNRTQNAPNDNANDIIVTSITDLNIRSIYTFDNYNYNTFGQDPVNNPSGCLMLSYTWDMNSDAFTPLDTNAQVEAAWDMVKQIYQDSGNTNPDYQLPADADDYVQWAIDNGQVASVVWTQMDGFAGGYRMADPGRNAESPSGQGQQDLWDACTSSMNKDTQEYTGFFPAGEAIAWLGLSGWIEGAIRTGIGATVGTVAYLNANSGKTFPDKLTVNGKSFCCSMLPGDEGY